MKIAHVADIHIRSVSRHPEYKRAFKILFKELKEIKPDIIINCGDLVHSKTNLISPELIDMVSWVLNELSSIAPTYSILGNHDGNLQNNDRQDTITPINNAINNLRSIVLKNSESKIIEVGGKKIALHPYSPFDKEHWDNLKPIDGCINIALFHGPVTGCLTDLGWDMGDGEKEVSFFEQYDFTLLGDIHQQQHLGYRNDINNISKPYIAYPGSLLQQNHGEVIKKGYYVWDIRDKDDWDVEWKKLINLSPFVTLNWAGSVEQTLEDFEQLHGDYAYMPETKYRIVSDVLIPQVQTKQIIDLLKINHKAAEVIFKTDLVSNMETVNAHGIEIDKKSLSQDPVTMTKLYEKYMESNKNLFRITKEEQEEDAIDAAEIIKTYCQRLYTDEKDNTEARNVQWSIKEFKFDNLFGYGEGNTINFENLHSIVGILGNNRVGKSSIIGGLMYVLYNTTDRGSVKNSLIINTNKDYCSGTVRINVSGDEYLIERKTTRVISKKGIDDDKATTSLNLWLIENKDGQEVKTSRNGTTRDDTDKNIRNLIGNSDDFLLTAFASQNNINRFIENKATKRKEILNRFLELDIFEKLFLYAKNDYQNLDNQSKNYSAKDWAKLIERTEKEIEKYKEDVSSTEDKIASFNNKRDQLNLWISSNENTAKAIDTTSISSLETQINAFKHQLDTTEEKIKLGKSSLKGKQKEKNVAEKSIEGVDIKTLEADLESFDSLKDNFNKLQKDYDTNVVELNTQQKAVTKLKMVPCEDKFPNCHYIKDAHKAKKTIGIQTALVQKLSSDIDNCKNMLEQYVSRKLKEQISNYKDSNIKILMLSSEIARIEDKIEHDNKNVEALKRDLKDLETKLKTLKKSIELVDSEEFSKKKQQMDDVISELSVLNSKKNDLLINLGGKQDFLSITMSEQTQGKDLIKKLKLYDSIQSAFSKNGIPAMVLKNQLPAINIEMAKVLDGLINFTVSLETDTSSNVMDVMLEDTNNCKRQIELCSGMEKTICSLALRVALGNLSSLPRPDIFILDESFSALDECNLQKAMELLSLFRGYFKSVLVISHQTQIKEISDMIIEIKNNGIESKIEQ